jgi:uncharacterized protein (DUF433 family)
MAHDRITRDPGILMGKPCIKGTRISVERILEDLADGNSVADVLTAYEHLSEQDVRAALAYAAEFMGAEGLIPAE